MGGASPMTDANLFDIKPRPKKAAKPKAPAGEAHRIIATWAKLFEAKFREKPIIIGKDAGAVKTLLAHASADVVERRLKAYLALDDQYIAGQGYPLSLMLSAWNRLIALEAETPSKVPDAARTDQYLSRMKGAGK